MVCLIFLFSVVLFPFANADWTMFHADVSHSGVGTGNAVLTPTLLWKNTIDTTNAGDIDSSPAVVNGVVYISALNLETTWPQLPINVLYISASVYALNADTGGIIWNRTITGNTEADSSPAVVGGVVYVGLDYSVYAVNASNGAIIWNYVTGNYVESSPTVVNGVVYVGSDDGNVYALSANDGTKLWNYTTAESSQGNDVYSSPAVVDSVFYVGSYDGNVYALNAANGNKLWNYTTPDYPIFVPAHGDWIYASPSVANGMVFIASYDDDIFCLNATNGNQIWNYQQAAKLGRPLL